MQSDNLLCLFSLCDLGKFNSSSCCPFISVGCTFLITLDDNKMTLIAD